MKLLDAVNIILRRIGEAEVTGLQVPYPTVTLARAALEQVRIDLLVEGWYFNTFQWRNLLPNQWGRIEVPTEVLVVYPHSTKYIHAGKYIRHAETGEHVDTAVVAKVIVDVPFEELPVTAQQYIAARAAYDVYTQDFGADDTSERLIQEAYQHYSNLGAQHTNSRKHNARQRLQWKRIQVGRYN